MTVTPRKRKFNSDHPDIQQIVNEYGLKYHCNHCTKEITHLAFVKCLECKTETCVECFNCQHSYQVMHSLNFPLFEKTWAADEELLFVEGLELFGIGNWEQISEHIGTKNKQQVEEHYAFILESPDFPKFNTCSNFEKTAVRQAGFTVPELEKYPRVYFLIQAPPSAPANHEILGFMPGRREFDFEFENDAEQQIKEIEFLQDDSPEEIEFKCTMLNIYNHVLDQRMRRKKLIFDHDLTDFKKISANDRKRNKDEIKLLQQIRVFARMMPKEDYDQFQEDMLLELQLKQKVYQFQEYRMMGLRTQKEALKYEQEKSSRNSKLSGGYEKMFPKKVAEKHAPSTQHPIRLSLPGTPVLARSAVKPKNIPIATSPSYELLLPEEQKLCHSLNIYPKAYLSIKDVLIKENLAMGLKSKHVKQLLKIDGGKAQIIFDFFKQLGWIHS